MLRPYAARRGAARAEWRGDGMARRDADGAGGGMARRGADAGGWIAARALHGSNI
jgi:hypothetical protein